MSRTIIISRFGLGGGKRKTLEEVAIEFGISRERIRQLEAKALRELAEHPKAELIKRHFL